MASCPTCGNEIQARWLFCRGCGAPATADDVPAEAAATGTGGAPVVALHAHQAEPDFSTDPQHETAPEEHDAPSLGPTDAPGPTEPAVPAPASSKRVIFTKRRVITALVVASLIAGFSTLTAWGLDTRSRLSATEDTLATTEATLQDTEDTLSETRATLATRTKERDSFKARYNDTLRELKGMKRSLTNARNRIELQAGQIDILKTCLNGVAEALVYVAYGDYYSASAALDAVSVSCNRAADYF